MGIWNFLIFAMVATLLIWVALKFPHVLLNLDRRIIYVIVGFMVLFPLLRPLQLPFSITPEVRGIYEEIDKLPAGSRVLIAADFDPASKAELQPMLEAALAHCFLKDLRPTILTLWEAGPRLHEQAIQRQARRYDKVAGVDYVFLGYKSGTSAVILGLLGGISNTYATDHYGRPTESLPYFEDVRALSDYDYILDIAAGATVEAWVIYGSENANVPIGASCTAVSVAQYYPLLQAGQITGLSGGMKGSAEYEMLLDTNYSAAAGLPLVGDAVIGMDAQSMVHIFIVVSIIIANIAYFITRRRPDRSAA